MCCEIFTKEKAHVGDERNVYKVLMGKPEGKRAPGTPRRR
jgi:hypothetical protein